MSKEPKYISEWRANLKKNDLKIEGKRVVSSDGIVILGGPVNPDSEKFYNEYREWVRWRKENKNWDTPFNDWKDNKNKKYFAFKNYVLEKYREKYFEEGLGHLTEQDILLQMSADIDELNLQYDQESSKKIDALKKDMARIEELDDELKYYDEQERIDRYSNPNSYLAVKRVPRFDVKPVGEKYMLFDNEVGEFVLGYSFNNSEQAKEFIKWRTK